MNPSLIDCPQCRTTDYVRSVRDIHAAAARYTGGGGSVPYIGLLARMTGLPQPPPPPVPPQLAPPPALPALRNLVRSRRHILRYAAIVSVATLAWFAISVPLAKHYFPRQATGHAIWGLLVGDFWGFAVIIAPIYACVALIVQRRRLSELQGAWHAYNSAVAAVQQRLAAQRAAQASALQRARRPWEAPTTAISAPGASSGPPRRAGASRRGRRCWRQATFAPCWSRRADTRAWPAIIVSPDLTTGSCAVRLPTSSWRCRS